MEDQQNRANQMQDTVPDERDQGGAIQDEFTVANRDINQGQLPQGIPEAKESVVREQGDTQREQEVARGHPRTA